MMLAKAIRQSVAWVVKSAQVIASTKIGFLHVEGPKGSANETAQTQRARLLVRMGYVVGQRETIKSYWCLRVLARRWRARLGVILSLPDHRISTREKPRF